MLCHSSTRNIILKTMNSAAPSSRTYYLRPGFRHNGVVLIILEYYYSTDGKNIYHVSFVPRHHFSYLIPNGMLTNTMDLVLPNANNI